MTSEIRILMDRSGIPASAPEVERFARSDKVQRSLLDALYAVDDARYADPALVFTVEVSPAPWQMD